ncbi:hypothetical protein IU436_28410 [Nocardia farcinica]|uniref:hypothetical protein n=1 Tax=Nocardia farcinica TaxID=37329 RepID=UPI001894B8CD|nr:hypothetical protein [Nocardia farcinica]MBF6422583.1 hypothetical protein [Nocardia farcinica]MBF6434261.1 hypothetical protein [Nocardia farcinica]MBF6505345.1 hypothetical protein [Nocardia farcinica]
MAPPKREDGRLAADDKLLNFRLPAEDARQLTIALSMADLTRQTLITALVAEWQAGRIVVDPDGTVRYPEVERLTAEAEQHGAQ